MAGFRFRFSILRTVALVRSQDARMRATMLTVLGLVIAAVVGFGTIWYIRKQQKVAADDLEFRTKQKDEKAIWADKHDEARNLVLQTDKRPTFKTGVAWGYQYVFPDAVLRSQIETYIVQMDSTGINPCLKSRDLEPDKFLLPTVKKAIQQTIDTVKQFKREHPEESVLLGL